MDARHSSRMSPPTAMIEAASVIERQQLDVMAATRAATESFATVERQSQILTGNFDDVMAAAQAAREAIAPVERGATLSISAIELEQQWKGHLGDFTAAHRAAATVESLMAQARAAIPSGIADARQLALARMEAVQRAVDCDPIREAMERVREIELIADQAPLGKMALASTSTHAVQRLSPREAALAKELTQRREAEKLEERKQEATKALLAQFDQLNAAWTEKEKELLSIHIPEEVAVEYKKVQIDSDQGTSSKDQEVFCLALAKHRGQWRLCHGSYVLAATGEKEGVRWRPIVDCPLEFRLDAAQHFDALKMKAIEMAESSIAKVKAAVEKLRQA